MRHEALLAEVRGAVADRKRKRTVVASEAYPDSEYNLPPTSASAGEQYSTLHLISCRACFVCCTHVAV